MKKFLLSAFIAVAAMSCKVSSVDDTVNPNEPADLNLTVNVASASAADSRIAIDGYSVEWSEGDALGAWGENLYDNTTFNKFSMTQDGFGEESSTFSGTIDHGSYANALRFVYPYTKAAVYALDNTNGSKNNYCNAFDVSVANQTIEAENAHLAKNTYMMSETVTITKGEAASSIKQTPSMKHLGAVLDLSLMFDPTVVEGCTLSSVDVISEKLPTLVSVNMQKENVEDAVVAKEFGTITLNVEGTKGQTDYLLSCNIFPFKLVSGDKINFVAHFVNPESNEYATITKEVNLTENLDFARAQRHALQLTMDGDLVEEKAPVENEKLVIAHSEFGSYNTSVKTKTISGITFQYLQLMKSEEKIQWKSDRGYIFNTDAINGIVSVSFENKTSNGKNSWWTVMQSSTPIKNKTDGQVVTYGADGVYTFDEGMNYFCVYNNGDGSGAQTTSDITVEYTGVNESGGTETPAITGVNPSQLSFEWNATESLEANIEGTSLKDVADKDYTVEVTQGTEYFDAIVSDGKLLVEALKDNDGSEAYTGEIKVSVNDSYAILEVSQKGQSQVDIPTNITYEVTTESIMKAKGETSIDSTDGIPLDDVRFDDFTLDYDGGSVPLRAWKDGTIRSYIGNKLTVTAKNGKSIVNVEFSAASLSNPTTGTVDDKIWSGEAESVTFSVSRAQSKYIKVTVK